MAALRNRILTARDIARMPEVNMKNDSARTISRGLDQEGLKPRVASRKPRMTSKHRRLRLEFVERTSSAELENDLEWLFLMRLRFADQNKKKYALDLE